MSGFKYITYNEEGELVEYFPKSSISDEVKSINFDEFDVDAFIEDLRSSKRAILENLASSESSFEYFTHDEKGNLVSSINNKLDLK